MAGLENFVAQFGLSGLLAAVAATAAGGFAKGVVGFALPLIAMSALASVLPFDMAVALLILPMLVSNAFQGTREGPAAAAMTFWRFRRLNVTLAVVIALSAQLVLVLPKPVLYGGLGLAITGFGLSQLAGWRPSAPDGRHRDLAELGVGGIAGFFGGIAGIWGPPITMYLMTTNLPKADVIRAQALSFFLGSLVLALAHLHSGVLNARTFPVSALLVVPTLAGMFLGYGVQDRLDQHLFRKVTLAILVVSGLNLLRRAF